MALSVVLYLALLAAFGAGRIGELRLSAARALRLAERGARRAADPGFGAMVALHVLVPLAAALEVLGLRRPFWPALGFPMLALFLGAQGVRFWAIRALGEHWNVRVVASTGLGVVADGPYCYVRHPNYAAVFVEMTVLPLVHTAWLTTVLSAPIHWLILRRRVALEDRILLADPAYHEAMADKPRFLPWPAEAAARKRALSTRKA